MNPEVILALVTLCSSLLTFYLAFNVGMTRQKHASSALDTKQAKEVIIANRVHMNQIENMVVYLPILWVAGIFGPTALVAPIALIWFISRVVYSFVYMKNPEKRATAFIIGIACIGITSLLALYGLVAASIIFK